MTAKNLSIGLSINLELNQPIQELEELVEGMKRIRNKQKHNARHCRNCESLDILKCRNKKVFDMLAYSIIFEKTEDFDKFLCPYFKFASDEELAKRYEDKKEEKT